MKQHWVDRHGFLAGLAFIAVIVAVGLLAVFVVAGAFLLLRDHRETIISALVGAVVGGTAIFDSISIERKQRAFGTMSVTWSAVFDRVQGVSR
jgi:hypothetical protein